MCEVRPSRSYPDTLAHAVVNAEDDENWLWFAIHLYNVIHMHAPAYLAPRFLSFISDPQKGLLEAVGSLFPGSPHGWCLRHLYENFHKQFKHLALRGILWNTAHAIMEDEYNTAIETMHGINPTAVQWLLQSAPPEH